MVGDCCAFILLQRLQVSPLTVVIRFSVLVVLTPIIIVVLLFYRTQRVKIKLGGGGISTFFINFEIKSSIGPAEWRNFFVIKCCFYSLWSDSIPPILCTILLISAYCTSIPYPQPRLFYGARKLVVLCTTR